VGWLRLWATLTHELNFQELLKTEVQLLRIPLPRNRVNRGAGGPSIHPTGS
jgi:hypothetical protein